MVDGLELASDEINAGGLAGGIPVRLIVKDDRFDWELSRSIDIGFARETDMSAVIGYYDDVVAIKASIIFESAQLLHLIVGVYNTPMTAHGFDYIVRTTLSSDKIARALARMLVERGYKKFALIWEQGDYGQDLSYQFGVTLDNLGLQWVYQQTYSRDNPDFRLAVNELKGIDADVIFFAGLEPWAGDFLRAARGVGLKTDIVGAFSNTPEMRRRAGPAIEGAMYFDMYDVNSPTPENQAFVRKFRARYGRYPDTWAAQGYDALHILARAVKATHSANPRDLAYAVRYMDTWQGANGQYKFDGAGEMDYKPVYLKVFRNGAPVTLGATGSLGAPRY
jgi:branched-chain amino acid transport system substrate-binding protein